MTTAHDPMKPHASKSAAGESAKLLEQVATELGSLKQKVSDLHTKLSETRSAAVPTEFGDALLKKEQEGAVPTQGQVDMLARLKTGLEQLESQAKAEAVTKVAK